MDSISNHKALQSKLQRIQIGQSVIAMQSVSQALSKFNTIDTKGTRMHKQIILSAMTRIKEVTDEKAVDSYNNNAVIEKTIKKTILL